MLVAIVDASVVLAFDVLASVAFFQGELPSTLCGKLAHDQLRLSPLLPWLHVHPPEASLDFDVDLCSLGALPLFAVAVLLDVLLEISTGPECIDNRFHHHHHLRVPPLSPLWSKVVEEFVLGNCLEGKVDIYGVFWCGTALGGPAPR